MDATMQSTNYLSIKHNIQKSCN